MSAKTITSSLSIAFSYESTLVLKAEVDSRSDGYNKGKTSFIPGDSPYFLVYPDTAISLLQFITSEGSIADHGSSSRVVEEWVDIAYARETSLSYFPANPVVIAARCKGSVSFSFKGDKLLASSRVVARVRVRYDANFRVYSLNGAAGDTDVLIHVIGSN